MTQIKTERSMPSLRLYLTSPPHHRTVSPRAQAQGNHCSEMQTTQLKVTQALKHFPPKLPIPPAPQSLPTGFSEWKSQTPLTRHSPHPGTRAPGWVFSRGQMRVPGFRPLLYPQVAGVPGSAASSAELALSTPGAGAAPRPQRPAAAGARGSRPPGIPAPPRAPLGAPGRPHGPAPPHGDTHPCGVGRASAGAPLPSAPPGARVAAAARWGYTEPQDAPAPG